MRTLYWCDVTCIQTLSEDNLTQLDEFYQLIAPSAEGDAETT